MPSKTKQELVDITIEVISKYKERNPIYSDIDLEIVREELTKAIKRRTILHKTEESYVIKLVEILDKIEPYSDGKVSSLACVEKVKDLFSDFWIRGFPVILIMFCMLAGLLVTFIL